MIFGFLILVIAISISVIAAWYSIAGLVAIFAAAAVPVIIMGGALEAGKIAATVWLHNNWERAGWRFKAYLVPAVIFLMILTSMGIFGFLSKAHLDQNIVSGDGMAKVAIYDEKIKTARENIDANRRALKQMDEAVDQLMARTTDDTGAQRAANLRRNQARERTALQADIAKNQQAIAQYNEERAPLAAEYRKIEAEVGPIKYIAALIYGEGTDANALEQAVRWVIILIVIVFDPLALALILAGNKQLEWARRGRGGWVHDDTATPLVVVTEPKVEETPEPKLTPLEEEELEEQKEKELKQFFWRGRMIAKALDSEEAERTAKEANSLLADIEPTEQDITEILDEIELDALAEQQRAAEAKRQQDLLDELASELERISAENESAKQSRDQLQSQLATVSTQLQSNVAIKTQLEQDLLTSKSNLSVTETEKDQLAQAKEVTDAENTKLGNWVAQLENDLREAITIASQKTQEVTALGQRIAELQAQLQAQPAPTPIPTVGDIDRPGDYITPPNDLGYEQRYFDKYQENEITGEETNASFGTEFPNTPGKGDLFLRVDYMPERLYKWNGSKWIMLDKSQTDRYAYDTAYIQHLVEKMQRGEIDAEDLNDTERTQVAEYLSNAKSQ